MFVDQKSLSVASMTIDYFKIYFLKIVTHNVKDRINPAPVSAVALWRRLRVRTPPGGGGGGGCPFLVSVVYTCLELWCVVTCHLETSRTRRLWPALGYYVSEKKGNIFSAK
jgi:hypothetical protein